MSNTIPMSRQSLDLIKSLANVNNSIAFKAGNMIRVVNSNEAVVATLHIPESFPHDFSIAEVNKFVGIADQEILRKSENLELVFDDSHCIFKTEDAQIRYRYTHRTFLSAPEGELPDLNCDFTATIDGPTLSGFLTTASSLRLTLIEFVVTEDHIIMRACNPELGDESNNIEKIIGPNDLGLEPDSFGILRKYLNLHAGGYEITIDGDGYAMFRNIEDDIDLVYIIGVEMAI